MTAVIPFPLLLFFIFFVLLAVGAYFLSNLDRKFGNNKDVRALLGFVFFGIGAVGEIATLFLFRFIN